MKQNYISKKLAKLVCVCVCAFLGISTNANAQMICGQTTSSSTQINPIGNRVLINQASLQEAYCIKIYMHVIRDGNGNGGQPDSAVFLAFYDLNRYFNPYNIFFEWDRQIINVPDQGYFTLAELNILTENTHTDGIDIFLHPDVNGFWGGISTGVLGDGTAFLVAGRFQNDPALPIIRTPFLAHEMGHVLGLWHTFHGTYQNSGENSSDPDDCIEYVNGNEYNRENCGDYVRDTPADPFINFNVDPISCEWLGSGSDGTGPYMPSTSNYMTYTHPDCMADFTPVQVQRMKTEIETSPRLQNVLNSECCAITNLDLFIKDSAEDFGVEPNPVTENMWVSEDIWIRNSNDNGLMHENPEYNISGTPNYINVRIINRSCETSTGTETLTINWAKASTSLPYPENWDGTLITDDGEPMGGQLPTVVIPIISGNDEVIVKVPWVVPNPADYSDSDDPWHFCLLATILGSQDGLTYGYSVNPNEMVRNNNNQAWKNISVVNLIDGITSAMVMVANPSNIQRTFTLEFVIETTELGKAIYTEAEVGVEMDAGLFTIWERGGKLKNQLLATPNEKIKIITANNASLDNLLFYPNERAMLTLNFNMLIKELTAKNKYTIHVIQKDKITSEVIGGETFVVYKDMRESFSATAGDDKQMDSDQTITISPQQINEAATYNWYDPEGNLIYQGTTLTVTAAMAKTYTLEVIADADGYKDYDEVEITLKPSRIETVSPNPLTTNALQIYYKLNDVASSYLMIVDQNSGVSQNYILNTASSNIILNLSSYTNGFYTIALVCDGEIVDAQTFIKQ